MIYDIIIVCLSWNKTDFLTIGEASLMWVDKYRPRSIKQIIGQQGDKSNMRKLINWLRAWDENRKKPPSKGDCLVLSSRYLFVPFDRARTRFSVPQVLRCPAGIDCGCQVISGFGRHLELTDTLGLDLMLVSIRCQTR